MNARRRSTGTFQPHRKDPAKLGECVPSTCSRVEGLVHAPHALPAQQSQDDEGDDNRHEGNQSAQDQIVRMPVPHGLARCLVATAITHAFLWTVIFSRAAHASSRFVLGSPGRWMKT